MQDAPGNSDDSPDSFVPRPTSPCTSLSQRTTGDAFSSTPETTAVQIRRTSGEEISPLP
uniref:Uncharacterized protein n=1 Tax=Triticum urartu TaxID=4572 RepID=A0A8R7UQ12_TRIUA